VYEQQVRLRLTRREIGPRNLSGADESNAGVSRPVSTESDTAISPIVDQSGAGTPSGAPDIATDATFQP
jgi:hypothetical protein